MARRIAWWLGSFLTFSTEVFPISFTWFKSEIPRSFNISINFTKISAVQAASSTARWWFSKEIFSVFATVSSLTRFSWGSRTRANATVSTTVYSQGSPCRSQFLLIKLMSNPALWATITEPSQNFRNSGKTSSTAGAPNTISSRMPVSSSILNGIGTCGFTKAENRSVTFPSSTFTAPISMMRLLIGEKPVVSKSNTTNVPSSPCPFGFSTICFKSSTR